MDDFEHDLREAFERQPAPPSLKRKLMERRRIQRPHGHAVPWMQLAASVALAAVLGGALAWRHAEERRKGEAARQQVLTALRITSHALNDVHTRLIAHDRADQE